MKTAQQILKHIQRLVELDEYEIEENESITPERKAYLSGQVAFAKNLEKWIEAPAPFDRDLMGRSDDKEG